MPSAPSFVFCFLFLFQCFGVFIFLVYSGKLNVQYSHMVKLSRAFSSIMEALFTYVQKSFSRFFQRPFPRHNSAAALLNSEGRNMEHKKIIIFICSLDVECLGLSLPRCEMRDQIAGHKKSAIQWLTVAHQWYENDKVSYRYEEVLRLELSMLHS